MFRLLLSRCCECCGMHLRIKPHRRKVYEEKVRVKKSEFVQNVLIRKRQLTGLQRTYTHVANVSISGLVGMEMVMEMAAATKEQRQQQYL